MMWAFRLLLLLALAIVMVAGDHALASEVCPVASSADSILGIRDSCFVSGLQPRGVVDGDEIALQRALRIVHNNEKAFVAVLFYAAWCSFSQLCRPNFNKLSTLFPDIPHFAFEESVIRPSILSRYGVHGFPTLFLLNSTMRVRYHGSRSINSFITFYTDVTGIKPESPDPKSMKKIDEVQDFLEVKEGNEPENCPFSWARSPEKLLQQDTYLALAAAFVLMRLFYFMFPMLKMCIKRTWRRHIRYTNLMTFWDSSSAYLEQARQSIRDLNPYKRGNLQGAMKARAWASKSLASVSIGEPSSGRMCSMSDRR